MKYKIGDIVQIVKVNIPEDISSDSPDDYIGQLVTIHHIDEDSSIYPYQVYFNDGFNGDYSCDWWAEDELDYPDDKFQEKIIWDKLISIADDILKLSDISNDRLKAIYCFIEGYQKEVKP